MSLHRCKHQHLHRCGHQALEAGLAPGGLPRRVTDLFAIVDYLTLLGNWASALFNDIEQNPMTGDRTT